MAKKGRPKKVAYDLIDQKSAEGKAIYELAYRLVDEHHEHLSDTNVRLAIVWCKSWKPDVDGRLTLGKCKKASELDRSLAAFDFVIMLNKDFWHNPRVTDVQRAALMDHELMHAEVVRDETGDYKRDEQDRFVFRVRAHDLEEFRDVVARHGISKSDIESFAQALRRAEQRTSGAWIGYTSLRETLADIGITIETPVIATWSDTERREVMTWAQVRKELEEKVNPATSETMPACLVAATHPPSNVARPN